MRSADRRRARGRAPSSSSSSSSSRAALRALARGRVAPLRRARAGRVPRRRAVGAVGDEAEAPPLSRRYLVVSEPIEHAFELDGALAPGGADAARVAAAARALNAADARLWDAAVARLEADARALWPGGLAAAEDCARYNCTRLPAWAPVEGGGFAHTRCVALFDPAACAAADGPEGSRSHRRARASRGGPLTASKAAM